MCNENSQQEKTHTLKLQGGAVVAYRKAENTEERVEGAEEEGFPLVQS